MSKIVSRRYLGVMPVYNMEVYGLHNYITDRGTVLHNCRYFAISRVLAAEAVKATAVLDYDDEDDSADYDSYMTGGKITDNYLLG